MTRYIFILLILSFMYSCGNQRKLQRSYQGKPIRILQTDYGNPASIIPRQSDSIYVYEKNVTLASTEISQGRLTLDPIITPGVIKTERFYFTVQKGIITGVSTDEEYKR